MMNAGACDSIQQPIIKPLLMGLELIVVLSNRGVSDLRSINEVKFLRVERIQKNRQTAKVEFPPHSSLIRNRIIMNVGRGPNWFRALLRGLKAQTPYLPAT